MISVYALLNVGVVCGLLPTTGLPLPFISYGGTSLLISMASVGVLMNIGENDDGRSFTFWGTQLGYHVETRWGEGNYRLFIAGASRDFSDPAGASLERRLGIGLSFLYRAVGRTARGRDALDL